MRINRESRRIAKSLFKICHENGRLNEPKIRQVVAQLSEQKPRHYLAILDHFQRLIQHAIKQGTVSIRSAAPLPDRGASIFQTVEKNFGPTQARHYTEQPNLLGGLIIQVGSDVWDGSVYGRLQNLKRNFAT